MTITAIDQVPALIAVDMQQGILPAIPDEEREKIVTHTAELADEFHRRGLPVVWVRAMGMPSERKEVSPPVGEPNPNFAEPDENLPIAATDLIIHKQALSGFTVPELNQHIQKHGVTQVLITDLGAGIGVESTARSAFDYGYNVVIISDAIADPMPGRLDSSLSLYFPAFAEVGTSADALSLLGGEA